MSPQPYSSSASVPLPIALEAYRILSTRQVNGTALETNAVGVAGNKVDLGICVASAAGAITIILPFIWNRAQRKLRHALIVGLATSDLVASCVVIASTSYLLDGGDLGSDRKFCNFLGYSLATAIWTQHLWNLSIAVVTYMLLVHPLSTFTLTVERRLPYLWPLFWAIAALVNGIAWRFVGFTNVGGYCLFQPAGNNLFSPLFQFIPRGIVVIVIVVLYAKLFVFLRRTNLFNRSESQTASHGSTRAGQISGLDGPMRGRCRCSCSSQGKPTDASISASRRSSPAAMQEEGKVSDGADPAVPPSRRSSRISRFLRTSLSQAHASTSQSFVANVFGHRFCECPCHDQRHRRTETATRQTDSTPAPIFSQPFVGGKTSPRRPRTADTTGPLGERVEMSEIGSQDAQKGAHEWGGVASQNRWKRDANDDHTAVANGELSPNIEPASPGISGHTCSHSRSASAAAPAHKPKMLQRPASSGRRMGSESGLPPSPALVTPTADRVWKRGQVEWYDIKPDWDHDTDSAVSADSHDEGAIVEVDRADEAMFMPASPTLSQGFEPRPATALAASAAVAAVASSPRRDPLATYRAAQMEARRDVVDFNMSSAPREHLNHFTVHAVYNAHEAASSPDERAKSLAPPQSPTFSLQSSRRPSANGSDTQAILAVLPVDPAAPGPEWEPNHDFEEGLGDTFSWGANVGVAPSGTSGSVTAYSGTVTTGKRSGSASADGIAQMTGDQTVPTLSKGGPEQCACPEDQGVGVTTRASGHICTSHGQTSTWTSDRHGVESLGSTLNRQASILMLLYPLAYTLLFSVSIIRILDDLANHNRVTVVQNRLHSVARWFILAQGALDAIIFLVIERHFRRRLKRRRKRALGEEVDEPSFVLAWRWVSKTTKSILKPIRK